jgi:hypothetical protein
MYFCAILGAAGFAVAFSLAPGQAEVLAVESTLAISGTATIGDPGVVSGNVDGASEAPARILKVNRPQLFPSIHSILIAERSPLLSPLNFPPGRRPFLALPASVDNVPLQYVCTLPQLSGSYEA